MFKFNSITFKDERSTKTIEVLADGTVISNHPLSKEDYTVYSLYAGIIMGGGTGALSDYLKNVKKN